MHKSNYLQDLTDEELALLYVEGNNRAFDLLLSRNEVKLFIASRTALLKNANLSPSSKWP